MGRYAHTRHGGAVRGALAPIFLLMLAADVVIVLCVMAGG